MRDRSCICRKENNPKTSIDGTKTLYYDGNRKSTRNLVACGAFYSFMGGRGEQGGASEYEEN